ncbi:unnamed protein product [Closterium sp. NIES-54]
MASFPGLISSLTEPPSPGLCSAPPAIADVSTHSLWLSRDATARLAIRNHLPATEYAHFGEHRTAQALYDTLVARYSSPATAAIGRLLLPYLFPELSAFAIVADLVTHLRTSDARYPDTIPAEFLPTNQPPMFITLYFIVTHLPDSLRSVRDHFLTLDPTSLTIALLEQHLLTAETSAVAVGAARGTPRSPFSEGCSPSPLSSSFTSAAAADVSVAEDIGAASTSAKCRNSKGKGGRGSGGGSGGGGGGSGSGSGGSGRGGGGGGGGGDGGTGGGGGGSSGGNGGSEGSGGSGGGGTSGGRSGPQRGGPGGGRGRQQQRRSKTQTPQQLREWLVQRGAGEGSETCPYVIRTGARAGRTCGRFHTERRCFGCLDNAWRAEFGDDVERPRWAQLLQLGVDIFDLDFDVIISAIYALSVSAEGDSYQCVPPDPGIAAAALGASASCTPPGIAPAEALHSFTLDSGASRCFFRDSTTLTPLPAPVPVRLADPSGGPVVASSSTVLPCPAVSSGSLSGLHLPSFSTNLVSTAAFHDAMVTTTTLGGQRVSICTCTRMGRHLVTFIRRPGWSQYTVDTESPQVAASAQVSASGQVAASCSCRLLSHLTLLWHHRLGHPSLPRLRGMHSCLLGSGLPRSLPPLPPLPAPPSLPCIKGRQRAAPHSSSFPPTTATLQTLHVDRFGQDLPVLRLHSDKGGEFSSNLVRDFCRGEGITQSFTLPDSPQQNGIAEHRIGLVMEVARTSMIHAAAPHFLWPFAVRYAAHQLNLWPRVSLPETSPTLRWTGKVGDVSVFRGPAPSKVSQVDPLPGPAPVQVAVVSGTAPCTASGGAASGGAEPGGAGSEGAGSGGAEPEGVEPGDAGAGGAAVTTRAGEPMEPGAAGAGGAGGGVAGVGGPGAGGTGAALAGVVDPGAGGAGGTVRPCLYFVPLLQRFLPASPLPVPSPYTEQSGGLTKCREPASRPASPVCTVRRAPRSRPPPVPGTHTMALCPSSDPQRIPLPAPPESSLPAVPDPESDRARAASPTAARLLAAAVTDPSFESAAASAHVTELLDFAAACRLDYAYALVAESLPTSPPSVGGECALGTDVLEDRREEFECLAAAVPRFASMLLALEGDPDAPDIPTPCSYPEAIWVLTPLSGRQQWMPRWHPGSPQALTSMRTTLAALEFAPSTVDPSLFLRTDTSLPPFYVLVYVDDLVFATADTKALTLVKSELQKRHTCTDLGELRSCLGLQITRDRARHAISLTQSHMVHQVLQRFGFQYSSPQLTPLSTCHSLSAPPSDESVEPSGPYPELVGCLMYLMTCTRPDLAYPLSLLARYVAPGRHQKVHWDALKRVLRYLCSTSGMGLVLGGQGLVVLIGHADASWVDDSATQRSSEGYTFSLGSGSVSWRSTRSSSVLSSSCEAEIYARAMAAQELRWLTYLLIDLGEQPRLPPVLYVDYKAMIALCQEHRLEHRTKHIALRYFLARELQQRGQLRLAYVATWANC